MCTTKSRLLLRPVTLAAFLLSIALIGPPTWAKPPGGHLNITEVFVDATELIIKREDFDIGAPVVGTLGEFGQLTVTSVIPPEIKADLPVGIAPGDYLLTVSTGNGQSQNDEYDLTIGAAGSQGPPAGPLGPPAGQVCDSPQVVIGFDINGNIICGFAF